MPNTAPIINLVCSTICVMSRIATLTVGIAMTDAKGDRSLRPHEQPNPNAYVHVVDRKPGGIVISGTKAIVTSAPYVHELLVLPGRAMQAEDRDFAVACAVPVDTRGLTIVARPAGRPGESRAIFSGKYGQTTGVCIFEKCLRAVGARVPLWRIRALRVSSPSPMRLITGIPASARVPVSAIC